MAREHYTVEWHNPVHPEGVWTDVTSRIWKGEQAIFDLGTLKAGLAALSTEHPEHEVRVVKKTEEVFNPYEWECDGCGRKFTILARREDMTAHFDDIMSHTRTALIQDRFPYLESWERQLITNPEYGGGLCDECWKGLHGIGA